MAKDINKMSVSDIHKQIAEKRKGLREFRFAITGSKTRNVRDGRNFRRDIARLLTELTKRAKQDK